MLTGRTKNRAEVLNKFKNNESIKVFLLSTRAGGVGLNLQEADRVVLFNSFVSLFPNFVYFF